MNFVEEVKSKTDFVIRENERFLSIVKDNILDQAHYGCNSISFDLSTFISYAGKLGNLVRMIDYTLSHLKDEGFDIQIITHHSRPMPIFQIKWS